MGIHRTDTVRLPCVVYRSTNSEASADVWRVRVTVFVRSGHCSWRYKVGRGGTTPLDGSTARVARRATRLQRALCEPRTCWTARPGTTYWHCWMYHFNIILVPPTSVMRSTGEHVSFVWERNSGLDTSSKHNGYFMTIDHVFLHLLQSQPKRVTQDYETQVDSK